MSKVDSLIGTRDYKYEVVLMIKFLLCVSFLLTGSCKNRNASSEVQEIYDFNAFGHGITVGPIQATNKKTTLLACKTYDEYQFALGNVSGKHKEDSSWFIRDFVDSHPNCKFLFFARGTKMVKFLLDDEIDSLKAKIKLKMRDVCAENAIPKEDCEKRWLPFVDDLFTVKRKSHMAREKTIERIIQESIIAFKEYSSEKW